MLTVLMELYSVFLDGVGVCNSYAQGWIPEVSKKTLGKLECFVVHFGYNY